MKLIKLAMLFSTVTVLSGCITLFGEQKKDEELKNRIEGLNVPTGMTNPLKSNEYTVDSIPSEFEEGEVSSPTTVLIIFEGSWLDPDEKHPAKIMLEKPLLVDNLPEFFEDGLASYAELNDLTLNKNATGYQATQIITEETGYWFWKRQQPSEEFSYQLNIDFKPHGRSGLISVDALDYKKLDEDLAPDLSENYRTGSLAVQTLNDIMLELDYLYRLKIKDERTSLDISLSLVQNIAGNYVISSQQDIKYVFSQIDSIISELGFDIEDEDDEVYVFDTAFKVSEDSIWDIFGKDRSADINIEPGQYEIALATTTTGVNISFRNKAGTYLNKEEMENLFKIFMEIVEEEEAEL